MLTEVEGGKNHKRSNTSPFWTNQPTVHLSCLPKQPTAPYWIRGALVTCRLRPPGPSDPCRSRRIRLRINGGIWQALRYKGLPSPRNPTSFLSLGLPPPPASTPATQRIARGGRGGGRRRGARVLISPRLASLRLRRPPPWRGSCWRRSRPLRRRPTRRPGRPTRRRPTAASTRCGGCATSASTPTSSSPRRWAADPILSDCDEIPRLVPFPWMRAAAAT